MSLITRAAKGSRLTIQEMDGNLTYLETPFSKADTAFVDPTNGNNATAKVGNGNLPYSTITAAAAESNHVVLLPGNYNEVHTLVSGVKYFAYPGVTFIEPALLVGPTGSGSNLENTYFLGHADFNDAVLDITTDTVTNLRFQANNMVTTKALTLNTNIYIAPVSASSGQVDVNYVSAYAGGGLATSFRYGFSGVINIKELRSPYNALTFRYGASQKCYVNIDKLTLIDGGFAGNAGGFKQSIAIADCDSGSAYYLNVKECENLCTTTVATGIGTQSNISCSIHFKGNTRQVTNKNISVLDSSILVYEGGMEAGTYAIGNTSTSGTTIINNSNIIQNSASSLVGTLFLNNSTTYTSTPTQNFITSTNAASKFYANNVVAGGGTGSFFYGGAGSYGYVNVTGTHISASATSVDLYTSSSYTQETALVVPTII